MSAFVLIALLLQYEYSWDDFHVDKERIYRVQQLVEFNDQTPEWTQTVYPLAEELRTNYSEFEQATVLREIWGELMTADGENNFNEQNGFYIEAQFFDIFSVEFIEGSREQSFSQPNAIILSDKAAAKYFPNKDPIGKILKSSVNGPLIVTGVYKIWPENAHLRPEYLVPFDALDNRYEWDFRTDWYSNSFRTYVKLETGVDVKQVNTNIRDMLDEKIEKNNKRQYLRPLGDLHLTPTAESERNTPLPYYAGVALFTLFLACINYINLTTAKSVQREKEIGVRKVVGGDKTTLFLQFIGESLMMSIIALALAFLIAELLLPLFNLVMQRNLSIEYLSNFEFVGLIVFIMIMVGIILGLYPALYLSSFNPLKILKGTTSSSSNKHSRGKIRKILVGFQFAISLSLITVTYFIFQQVHFMKSKDLGFNPENLIFCYMPINDNPKSFSDLRTRLLSNSNVIEASICEYAPFFGNNNWEVNWEDGDPNEKIITRVNRTGFSFASTYQLSLKKGRFLSWEFSDEKTKCVVNETFIEKVGWKEPIGKTIFDGKYEVIGVVEDFHITTVHDQIRPYLILLHDENLNNENTFTIRISNNHRDETFSYINSTLKDLFPDQIFDLVFYQNHLDHDIYAVWDGVRDTFGYFTFIAILIAIIGVIGLISFSIEKKTKEIGIRKVLGASNLSIYKTINKEFAIIQIIAVVVAVPLAHLLIQTIPGFYKYDMHYLEYLIPIITIGGLSLLATITITIRAAIANPVESLRSE